MVSFFPDLNLYIKSIHISFYEIHSRCTSPRNDFNNQNPKADFSYPCLSIIKRETINGNEDAQIVFSTRTESRSVFPFRTLLIISYAVREKSADSLRANIISYTMREEPTDAVHACTKSCGLARGCDRPMYVVMRSMDACFALIGTERKLLVEVEATDRAGRRDFADSVRDNIILCAACDDADSVRNNIISCTVRDDFTDAVRACTKSCALREGTVVQRIALCIRWTHVFADRSGDRAARSNPYSNLVTILYIAVVKRYTNDLFLAL